MHANTMRVAVWVTTLAMAWSMTSAADVIFDNETPVKPNPLAPYIAVRADLSPSYSEIADDFVLQPGANVITDVHWLGLYLPDNTPQLDNFTIRVFADAGAGPNTLPLYDIAVADAHRTDAGIDFTSGGESYAVYSYQADVSPITLSAGATYWLSIQNDTTGAPQSSWFWLGAQESGTINTRIADGGAWDDYSAVRLAFQLTNDGVGVVPEPASLSLLSLGLAGLTVRRWRKRV